MALPMRRGLLWGLLVAVLVIVVAATAVERFRRPEPPPVMWNAPDFKLIKTVRSSSSERTLVVFTE